MPEGSELAWLAGILEGEGSFMVSVNRGCRYPQIAVNMTDQDVIARVATMFGTSVYAPRVRIAGRKQPYRAVISGSRAAQLMADLRPWMGERRGNKIDEILAEYGQIEPTSVRRSRSCREAALRRYSSA